MEVNKLTYRLYKFLIKQGWKYNDKYDSKFIYLQPSGQLGLPKKFELRLPIKNKSKDFYSYTKEILDLLFSIYPSKQMELKSYIDLNEKLKHRFTKDWIIPEDKSRIEKITKFDIFIPN